ncbi:MAG TPA: ribonuclease III [Acidiferrobacteraceae bacterium]|nr:ribonuclease III [Acidiferrobacteraceae bacterium]HEX19736.1 ribonuclease III [Acidiferrobacteraceae bacterium]
MVAKAPKELSKKLNYTFVNIALLERALTHRSKGSSHNERLEFLGDSILNFSISTELYRLFPGLTEGDLTRMRASLVKKEALSDYARQLNLGDFLRLGVGELRSGGHDRDSILADALEAVFGAVYVDGGIKSAEVVILGLYRSGFDAIDPSAEFKDPKTRLQEYLQKKVQAIPKYEVLEVKGDQHSQQFIVGCYIPGLSDPVVGEGSNRRQAEQMAASRALDQLPK